MFTIQVQKRFLKALTAATVALVPASLAAAQFAFDNAVNTATGPRPDGIAAGDYDGDGDLDLAVITDQRNGGQERLEVYLNDGSGGYSLGQILILPNSSSPNEAKAGDFDRDGDLDVAVILEDFNQVMTLVNNGGTFSQGATASIGNNARGMDAADYDNDGDMDLAVANRDDNTATVLTSNGNGTFSSQTLAAGLEPRAAAFVNVNGAGPLDLAVTNHDSRSISIFTASGNVFSSAGTVSVPNPFRPEGIVGADFDGDGDGDLAVGAEGNGLNRVLVYTNNGGTFSGPAQYATGGIDTSGILAADLDCDGALDVATTNDSSSNISLLRNLGSGTFGAPQLLAAPSESSQFTAADLDGDGDLEIAVTNKFANSFSIFFNRTCEAVEIATLVDVTVIEGTFQSGGLPELRVSDDQDYRTAHKITGEAAETHRLNYVLGASTTLQSGDQFTITMEGSTDDSNTTVTLFLRDWNGGLEQVGQFGQGLTDTTHQVNVANANQYIRASDGRIEMLVKKHIVLPSALAGTPSADDLIQIEVQ